MSRCGDCKFFELCSELCRGLDENESFPETGGCEAFKSKFDFLPFSLRRELTELYQQWCEKHNAKECAFNVISFLSAKKLIDIESAINFINQEKERKQ